MSDKVSVAIRNARSAYQREWRKKNPNKNKEYINHYWERRVMREQMQKEMQKNGNNQAVSND